MDVKNLSINFKQIQTITDKPDTNFSVQDSVITFVTRKTLIYIAFAFASLFFLQCKSTQRAKSLRIDYESTYIEQFKLTYFRQLLKKGYNNSPAIQEILNFCNEL